MIAIALGANLPSRAGPPERTLRETLKRINGNGASCVSVSRFFSTPAWPDPSEPAFVNACAELETALPPQALMAVLAAIELDFGRIRGAKNAARTLDLDLLDYDGRILTGHLELPHPRLASRAFVLLPLADIAPSWCHPVSGDSIAALIAALPAAERDAVRPFYA